MPRECSIYDHVPDYVGLCKVCGQEVLRPCASTQWCTDEAGHELEYACQLPLGHENDGEDHRYGEPQ